MLSTEELSLKLLDGVGHTGRSAALSAPAGVVAPGGKSEVLPGFELEQPDPRCGVVLALLGGDDLAHLVQQVGDTSAVATERPVPTVEGRVARALASYP